MRYAILFVGRNNISASDVQKNAIGFQSTLDAYMALGQPWWIAARTEIAGVTTVTLFHADVKETK